MNPYDIGDIVKVTDNIDYESYNIGTIKFIEPDNEIKDLFWLYIIANDDSLNDKTDPKFSFHYWKILEHINPFIELLSKATVE